MRIWKHPLPAREEWARTGEPGSFTIRTPEAWRPIGVGFQAPSVVVWSEVEEPFTVIRDRRLHVVFTGAEVPDGKLGYVGSTTDTALDLVYHVYWEPPPINIVELEI
jgi:hypothetical protein